MKRIALIKNGIVETISIWDGVTDWNPGDEYTLVDVTDMACSSGWFYVDGVFLSSLPQDD